MKKMFTILALRGFGIAVMAFLIVILTFNGYAQQASQITGKVVQQKMPNRLRESITVKGYPHPLYGYQYGMGILP